MRGPIRSGEGGQSFVHDEIRGNAGEAGCGFINMNYESITK